MFWFRDAVTTAAGPVGVAFTDASLDVGDRAPEAVRRRALDALAEETGCRPALMRQVHGARVAAPGDGYRERPEADALVTADPGVALLTRAADCVPALLVDRGSGLLGALHAGRVGMLAGVVPATVRRLREAGATDLVAWLGPRICGGCYEVPDDMRAEAAAQERAAYAETTWGTPALDVGAAVRDQLERDGVEVVDVGGCTREDARLHSFRRDGEAAGRCAGVVWRGGHGTG